MRGFEMAKRERWKDGRLASCLVFLTCLACYSWISPASLQKAKEAGSSVQENGVDVSSLAAFSDSDFAPSHHAEASRRHLLATEDVVEQEQIEQQVEEAVERWKAQQKAGIKADRLLMPTGEDEETGAVSLGPSVQDWDEQRRDYLRKHPGSNVTRYGKLKMMMLTGSQSAVCGNDVGDYLLLKALKNKQDYCDLRDIPLFASLTILLNSMDSFWVKMPLLRKMMLTHPDTEWFLWIDSDAIITDMDFDIPFERYGGYDVVFHGWEDSVYQSKNWVGLNAGVMLVRNSQWTLQFFDAWVQWGAKKFRKEYGVKLMNEVTGRPLFDSDDQSALVWMLVYQREKWGSRIFLESSYYLHGYWQILTNRYEEMMEKFHPGHGDHRWPFVTHFVGCKPCSSLGTLDMEETTKCVEHMERALNFADNQILRKLGFQHLHLDTPQVVKINMTTYKATDTGSAHHKRLVG